MKFQAKLLIILGCFLMFSCQEKEPILPPAPVANYTVGPVNNQVIADVTLRQFQNTSTGQIDSYLGHHYINRGIVSHNNALVFPSFKRPENRLKPNQSDAKA